MLRSRTSCGSGWQLRVLPDLNYRTLQFAQPRLNLAAPSTGGLLLLSWRLLAVTALTAAAARPDLIVSDPDGFLGRVAAPVLLAVTLTPEEVRAASEGRLRVQEQRGGRKSETLLAAQFQARGGAAGAGKLWWLMPPGPAGTRTFKLREVPTPSLPLLNAGLDPASGQWEIRAAGKSVLRYNYLTNEPGRLLEKVQPGNRKYARARSDYIHPLYGLDGEELTKDWSVDHPHHRGIYWAWPEVDFRRERGDLHALQRVFARPTGQCIGQGGPVFAQIEAENLWRWEDQEPIVREHAIIRAFRTTGAGRCVDLEFHFTALKEEVSIARRDTDKYGSLNIRLAAVKDQQIVFHTDAAGTQPRMAWADLSGIFAGGTKPLGLAVLQSGLNPDYPGDWVKYPELNWFQPTFPAGGTRCQLKPGKPLVLRFRLWIHRDAKVAEKVFADQWRAFEAMTTNPPSNP